jgi:hypothetical protein
MAKHSSAMMVDVPFPMAESWAVAQQKSGNE